MHLSAEINMQRPQKNKYFRKGGREQDGAGRQQRLGMVPLYLLVGLSAERGQGVGFISPFSELAEGWQVEKGRRAAPAAS